MKKITISLLLVFALMFNVIGGAFAESSSIVAKVEQTEKKSLHVSKTDNKILGVCGGIAEYFGIDSNLVRIGFVVFTLFYGSGILLYIIMAFIMS